MRSVKAILLAGVFAAASFGAAMAQDRHLTVWFTKGYYPSEDRAIEEVVRKWEAQSGQKVDLSFFSMDDSVTKTISALEAGNPPDVASGFTFEFRTAGLWAYQDKLVDLTDVVAPIRAQLLPAALDGITLLDGKTGRRSVFAVPTGGNIINVFYWRDMVEKAGFKESDIPASWSDYWNFWCQKVQPGMRKAGQRVFGAGLPESTNATDTYSIFFMFLNAYNVQIVDKDGKLVLDQPANRAGLIKAMTDYTQIAKEGCTPPTSMTWGDADNNNAVQNRIVAMTPNPSLSIPGHFYDAGDMDTYNNNLRTAEFPNGADGKPIRYMVTIKLAVAFKEGKNVEAAKSFLAFLAKPENLYAYDDGTLGRLFPPTRDGFERPFWNDGKDPHRTVIARILQSRDLILFPQIYNYRFADVEAENVWGKAMGRILVDKVGVEQAVDEMLTRIKQILGS